MTPQTTCCASCGHPVRDVPKKMRPILTRIFRIVQGAGQAGIASDALIERLYVGRELPQDPYETVQNHVYRLNQHLRPEGTEVTAKGSGTCPGTYRHRKYEVEQ